MRLHGAWRATAIAEYFREQGKSVLVVDGLAHARRTGAARDRPLAIGEAPATKGYPPSVFARLPALVERAGNGVEGGGSITAFYTVLTEGDDQQDPIADSARDSRRSRRVVASHCRGRPLPAIDVEASISRAMHDIAEAAPDTGAPVSADAVDVQPEPRSHRDRCLIRRARIQRIDRGARRMAESCSVFLQQDKHERVDYARSLQELIAIAGSRPRSDEP